MRVLLWGGVRGIYLGGGEGYFFGVGCMRNSLFGEDTQHPQQFTVYACACAYALALLSVRVVYSFSSHILHTAHIHITTSTTMLQDHHSISITSKNYKDINVI